MVKPSQAKSEGRVESGMSQRSSRIRLSRRLSESTQARGRAY